MDFKNRFEQYCDKRLKRIGVTSKQQDFWLNAPQGYNDYYKSSIKVPTKELKKELEEMNYGRPMYAADMGYEYGKKKAILAILNWRDKNRS